MKFIALLKKELRECLPWLLLAMMIMLFLGTLIIQTFCNANSMNRDYWYYNPGNAIEFYTLRGGNDFEIIGPVILLTSIILGMILAGRQFWMPGFNKTWAYTIHRSTSRINVLLAKFAAAIAAFSISVGLSWTLLYWYASRPGVFSTSPKEGVFVEGWIFIIVGLIVYFGTALSGLSNAKWYTTKIFGLVFTFVIMILAMLQTGLQSCLVVISIGLVILLSRIINAFLTREF